MGAPRAQGWGCLTGGGVGCGLRNLTESYWARRRGFVRRQLAVRGVIRQGGFKIWGCVLWGTPAGAVVGVGHGPKAGREAQHAQKHARTHVRRHQPRLDEPCWWDLLGLLGILGCRAPPQPAPGAPGQRRHCALQAQAPGAEPQRQVGEQPQQQALQGHRRQAPGGLAGAVRRHVQLRLGALELPGPVFICMCMGKGGGRGVSGRRRGGWAVQRAAALLRKRCELPHAQHACTTRSEARLPIAVRTFGGRLQLVQAAVASIGHDRARHRPHVAGQGLEVEDGHCLDGPPAGGGAGGSAHSIPIFVCPPPTHQHQQFLGVLSASKSQPALSTLRRASQAPWNSKARRSSTEAARLPHLLKLAPATRFSPSDMSR